MEVELLEAEFLPNLKCLLRPYGLMGDARNGQRRLTMAKTLFETPIMISLEAISSIEDLNPQPKISINGPPRDGRCVCCGKHINDLKPFPGPGYYEGALLAKRFRPMAPPDEEVDRVWEEFFGGCLSEEGETKAEERLIKAFGKEKAEEIMLHASASSGFEASWECQQCIGLSTDEYFARLIARYAEQKKAGK
jgi:hypothetical protein